MKHLVALALLAVLAGCASTASTQTHHTHQRTSAETWGFETIECSHGFKTTDANEDRSRIGCQE